jgi:hypothetical protein
MYALKINKHMKKHLSAVRHELQKITLFSALLLSMGITAFGQIPNYVPSNGLVGWWPFNGNANDLSGNGNNGTVNGATLTTDRNGNVNSSYNFNGSNNYITVPRNNLFTSGISISCWFNATAVTGVRDLITNWQSSPSQRLINLYIEMGLLRTSIQSLNQYYASSNTISTNNWYHVCSIFDGQFLKIYFNGILTVTTIVPQANLTTNQRPNWHIGAAENNSSIIEYFAGQIDDIGIWNRALTQCEITALYNSQLSNPQLNAGNDLSVCAGDSISLTAEGATTYSWNNGVVNGQAFVPTVEGLYTVVGTDTLGCSNSDTLFLDLLQPTSSNIERIACDTYTAPDGNLYTNSGQYLAIIPNAEGCDSTIQLALTVNNSSASTQTTAELDSYTWPVNGQTYTQSGVYTTVIPNSKGCDSTITLNLSLEFSGISELNGKEIVITPNPVDASFTLIADSRYIGNEYVITNQQGAIVGKGTIRATKMEVNCGHLAKGIYLFQINSTDQHLIRVMKN